LAQPSKSISADPNSEALMTLSMPAIPFFISSRSCLCGKHEGEEEGIPHAHGRWMTTIHRRQAKTWPIKSGCITDSQIGRSLTAADLTANDGVRIAPEAQAIFCRRRHQPRRPAPAKISPGNPAPAMGPGTAAPPTALRPRSGANSNQRSCKSNRPD